MVILRVTTGEELVNRARLRIWWDHGRIIPKLDPLNGCVLAPKIDGLARL